MYAIVYFLVQMLCSYDASQTILVKAEAVRDEQKDIIELYRLVPLM